MLGSVTNVFNVLKGVHPFSVTMSTCALLSGAVASKALYNNYYYNPQTEDGQAWKAGLLAEKKKSTGFFSFLWGSSSSDALSALKEAKDSLTKLEAKQQTGQAVYALKMLNKKFPKLAEATSSTQVHNDFLKSFNTWVANSNTWKIPFTKRELFEETEKLQIQVIRYGFTATFLLASVPYAPSLVRHIQHLIKV